jgi:hypothetical protein
MMPMDPKNEIWSAIDGAWHVLNQLHQSMDEGVIQADDLVKFLGITAEGFIQDLDKAAERIDRVVSGLPIYGE